MSFFLIVEQRLGIFLCLMEIWPDLRSKTILRTDDTKNAEELVDCLIGKHSWGGTCYDYAIKEVKTVMESQWSEERYQIVPNLPILV